MTVLEIIRLMGNEFDSITDTDMNKWIELYSPHVSKKAFGKFYEQALALFVCHKLKMADQGENSLGELATVKNGFGLGSVSDGGTSISFTSSGGNMLVTDSEFTLTSYGAQFLQLRKTVIVPIHASGEYC